MNPILAALVVASAMPAPGGSAPAFSVESTNGKKVSLEDYKGKTLVLAFFPKAFTGG
jgi:peroxiredoxin